MKLEVELAIGMLVSEGGEEVSFEFGGEELGGVGGVEFEEPSEGVFPQCPLVVAP